MRKRTRQRKGHGKAVLKSHKVGWTSRWSKREQQQMSDADKEIGNATRKTNQNRKR